MAHRPRSDRGHAEHVGFYSQLEYLSYDSAALSPDLSMGDWLTRGTVWLAITLYVLSEWTYFRRPLTRLNSPARWFFTLGGSAYLVHVALAFHFFYQWSHAVGYAETARQTHELFGMDWGGGIFFNYAFTLVWLMELAWWWLAPENHLRRPRWIGHTIRGIFIFMIFNGAVVFPPWPVRALGLVFCAALVFIWWRGSRSHSGRAA